MALDIVSIEDGLDMGVAIATGPRAGNVLSVQLGSLEYAPDFGVDLAYFLENPIQFQNESFKAYLVQRLTESQVNVTEVIQLLETFVGRLTFYVGDANQTTKGYIR